MKDCVHFWCCDIDCKSYTTGEKCKECSKYEDCAECILYDERDHNRPEDCRMTYDGIMSGHWNEYE